MAGKREQSKKLKYLDIYIATKGDGDRILIGKTSLTKLVEQVNSDYTKKGLGLRLRTVTEPAFHITCFRTMDWSTEDKFRRSTVILCVIDGGCYAEHLLEIFTIRAHHFPVSDGYPGFCITEPALAMDCAGMEGPEILRSLEKSFRCKLMEPSESAFHSLMLTLQLTYQFADSGLLSRMVSRQLED